MAELPHDLNNKIISFLEQLPGFNSNNSYNTLILKAGLDLELDRQIQRDVPPTNFITLLVSTLQQYGTLHDGRDALEAVLEAAKQWVGQDKRSVCDGLIQELRELPARKSISGSSAEGPVRFKLLKPYQEKSKKKIDQTNKRRNNGEIYVSAIGECPKAHTKHFKGRDREYQKLSNYLEAACAVIVTGRFGIGKSALACAVLEDMRNGKRQDPDRQIMVNKIVYLSKNTKGGINFDQLFCRCLKLLAPEKAEEFENKLQSQKESDFIHTLPSSASLKEKKRDLIKDLFEDLNNEAYIIILLDNMEDLIEGGKITDEELCLFLEEGLEGRYGVRLLITSYKRLASCEAMPEIPLERGLDKDDCVQILKAMNEEHERGLEDIPDERIADIVTLIDCIPLGVKLIWRLLDAGFTWKDIEDTSKDFFNSGSNFQRLLEKDFPGLNEQERQVRKVYERLLKKGYERLDERERLVLEVLAVFQEMVSSEAIDYLLVKGFKQKWSPGEVNDILRRENLQFFIHRNQNTGETSLRYSIDQKYAYSLIPENSVGSPYNRQDIEYWAAKYYLNTCKSYRDWKSIDDLESSFKAFEHLLKAEKHDKIAKNLLSTTVPEDSPMIKHLESWGNYGKMIELLEPLQDKKISRVLKQQSKYYLGTAYLYTGRFQDAKGKYEEALNMAKDTDGELEGVSTSYNNLGLCYAKLGEIDEAINYLEDARGIYSEIYAHDSSEGQKKEGNILVNLGLCYAYRGDYDSALKNFNQAAEIYRNIQNVNYQSESLTQIGHILVEQKRFHKAIEKYAEAIEISDREYRPVQYYARWGSVLACLHNWCEQNGPTQELEDIHANVKEIANRYDELEKDYNIQVLAGIIALKQRNIVEARKKFYNAVDSAKKLLSYDKDNYEALDVEGLALSGLALCFPDKKKEYISKSIEVYKKARKINNSRGIVNRVMILHETLGEDDDLDKVRRVIEPDKRQ